MSDGAAHGRSHGKIKRSQAVLRRTDQVKNQPAQQCAAGNLHQRGQVMTRPALSIFFRSISRPTMNNNSDRPISEIVSMSWTLVIL
jgi:hypothetical protein